jgi:uncharacterized protein (TIGR02246 family)
MRPPTSQCHEAGDPFIGHADYNRTMVLRWLILMACTPVLLAQTEAVQTLMKDSEAAWNRGDLATFVSYYEDSPETTFMGHDLVRGGTKVILERYQKGYPTPESRGTLTYSDIVVRPLAEGLVLVTGKFELRRSKQGGGDAAGRYTLVLRRTSAGWKIIHDHSS